MWEVPRFRIRAYVNKLNRMRHERERKARQPGASLHLKRTEAEIAIQQGLGAPPIRIPARAVLNDLTPEGITVFAAEPIQVEKLVSLTLEHPMQFFVTGVVAYCRSFDSAPRVMSAQGQTFPYRVKILFAFRTEREREAVRSYCAELTRTVLRGAA